MKAELIKGQTLVEVLVALAILILGVSAGVYLFFSGQAMTVDAELSQRALYLARENLENARLTVRENFNNLQSASTTEDIYLKELTVESIDTYTKKVISRISWNNQKTELITYLTDWRNLTLIGPGGGGAGGGGGGGLSGDWLNPQTLASLDLGPGNEGMDVEVKYSTVFMASKASDQAKPDFYVIDATTPSSPSIKAELNTGKGLNSLSIRGNYAYLAHDKSSQQLQIVDINNENSPVLVSQTTLSSNNEEALSIFSLNNFVYIGSENAGSGPEFQIFDVSNPTSPIFKSSVEISSDVNDIYVSNNRAYLATSRDDKEIMIFDISNPSSPQQIGIFNNSGTSDGLSIFVKDNSTAFSGIGNKLVILNTENLNNITIRGAYSAGGSGDTVNDLYAREYLAFLGTSNANTEFQIVNIPDLNNPVFYSSYNFPQMATGVDYRDNTIYVSVRSNDALRIITSQ